MRLKFDVFTWTVVSVVLALVVAAIVTVNFAGGEKMTSTEYSTDDSPSTPVFNAILAVQRGDAAKARDQFSKSAIQDFDKRGYDPVANAVSMYSNDASVRRVRIVNVSQEKPDEAYVTIAEDNYASGGLFDRSTYTNERVVRVVREDGRWKVADSNLFY